MATLLKPHVQDAFHCFARNGRWGTCVDCPRSNGVVYPEFCRYTERYDHQLGIDVLVGLYKLNVRELTP